MSVSFQAEVPREAFPGGGEMGALVRAKAWADTPFGAIETWPQSLRTATALMLESSFAMVVAWGPEFRFLYNDRYRPILGNKHPFALGAAASDIFPEVWENLIAPLFMRTRRGESVAIDDLYIPLHRHGYLENCHFSIAYSPIRDESGHVGGMLAVVAETTERVEGERRVTTLRDLARRAATATSSDEACTHAAAILAENPVDVPFSVLYLLEADGSRARRVAKTGMADGHPACPPVIALGRGERAPWPLPDLLPGGPPLVLEDINRRFEPLASGPYPEPVHTAMVLPLTRPGLSQPYGFLIAGVSARKALNERYRDFFELAAEHITTAIANTRALEEERRRADALAEIDRTKTAFFSNVSHEFRTPLTLMLGPIDEVLGRGDQTPLADLRPSLDLTRRNSLRLLKLVNTLLDFSRLEAGRVQANYEPVDLPMLTADLAGVFRAAIEKAGLRLRVECEPSDEPAFVDRDMWEKMVFNLLSNALKFTLQGEIAVRLRRRDRGFELSISDTGVGIPEAELPNLFKRFHRIENVRSRTHEGSGIGLALVQELARLHGGTVAVSSRLGEGSTFTVTIPAGAAHLPARQGGGVARTATPGSPAGPARALAETFVEEALHWLPEEGNPPAGVLPPGQPAGAAGAGHPSGLVTTPRPARILLADDNADMRDYVRRLLGVLYTVESVADGEAALAAIRRQRPDLVLTDIMMPRLDGFGVLRAIRADPALRTLPVILLSARAGDEASAEGYDAGADDYLIKPFTARELLARIGAHLNLARLRNEIAIKDERLRARDRDNEAISALTQEIVHMTDAAAIVRTATRMVGAHLAVDRCYFVENDPGNASRVIICHDWSRESMPSLEGTYQLDDYGSKRWLEAISAGRLAVPDITTHALTRDFADQYAALQIAAYATAPFHREHQWVVTFAAATARPRTWTDEELFFLENAVARVWPSVERARAMAALRAELARTKEAEMASRRFTELVLSSDDAILTLTLDGTVTSWNPGAERMFGYAPAEILGQPMLKLVPPDRASEESEILGRVSRGEHISHYETIRRRKDGTSVDVSLSVSPLKTYEGKVIGASKIARDITARRRTERRQRALHDLLATVNRAASPADIHQAALEAILNCQDADRAAILLCDHQHVMRCVAWRGFSAEWRAVMEGSGPWRPGTPQPQTVAIDDLAATDLEPAVRAASGREGVRSLASIPLAFEQQLLGAFIVAYDARHAFGREELSLIEAIATQVAFAVARQHGAQALETLVNERTASLRQAIGQMEEFSYSVSHDLRSPVRAMRGYAGALLEDYGSRLDEEGRELLARIERNGRRMDRLIQDLLTYSRLARQDIALDVVSLDKLVHDVVLHYPEMLPDQADIEIVSPLPDVLAHEPSLNQAISNLLGNAVKFVRPGTRPRVRIRAEKLEGRVRLWVEDNGIGIPPEGHHRLFGMFERMHPKLNYDGTGIGLAIVRKAVERMQGSAGVHSDGRNGSQFWVELHAPRS